MLKNELLCRSFMLLCFGTAFLLLFVQWQIADSTPDRGQTEKGEASSQITIYDDSRKFVSLPQYGPDNIALAKSVRLVVDLSDRRVYLYHNDRLQVSYPVAVGQEGWQTPIGSFRVLKMQKYPVWRHPITGAVLGPGPDNPLGARWIGFWSDGRHAIGFHGTNQAELVGQPVSHGCLRMRDRDIQHLYDRLTLGTPIIVKN